MSNIKSKYHNTYFADWQTSERHKVIKDWGIRINKEENKIACAAKCVDQSLSGFLETRNFSKGQIRGKAA